MFERLLIVCATYFAILAKASRFNTFRSFAAQEKAWHLRGHHNTENNIANAKFGTNSTTHFFTAAIVDHFGSWKPSHERWSQRFYVDDSLWGGDNFPIFLYIGGEGLARGYWGQEALTESRFVAHPFKDSGRVYRTGDRVRWQADGSLAFIGRVDNQVKVRGYRIELGEIERQLQALAPVQDAVVTVQENGEGEKRLVGYIVPTEALSEDEAVFTEQRRDWQQACEQGLSQVLPSYMVPQVYVYLPSMPLA